MPDSIDFDPYVEWLQIQTDQRPPNHYAILGLDEFEQDVEKIDAAAKKRAAYLHQLAAGPHRQLVQKLLGEVATARRTLANSDSRQEYDESLRTPAHAAAPIIQVAGDWSGVAARPTPHQTTRSTNTAPSVSANRDASTKSGGSSSHIYLLTGCSVIVALISGLVFYLVSGERRVAATPGQVTDELRTEAKRKRTLEALAQVSDARRLEPKSSGSRFSSGNNTATTRSEGNSAKKAPTTKKKANPKTTADTPKPRNSRSRFQVKLPRNWVSKIPLLTDFSDARTIPFSAEDAKDLGLLTNTNQLRISKSPEEGNSSLALSSNVRLSAGKAFALRTRFPAKKRDIRLGVRVGRHLVMMRVARVKNKDHLLIMTDRGQTLAQLNSPRNAGIDFVVFRPDEGDRTTASLPEIGWVVQWGNRAYSGRMQLGGQPLASDVRFVWFNRYQDVKPPLAIEAFRYGDYVAFSKLADTPVSKLETKVE